MTTVRRWVRSCLWIGAVGLGFTPAASARNQVWLRQLGTSTQETAAAAAPDGSGGVYFAGFTAGDLGGPPNFVDAWLARFDSGNNLLWIRQFGTSTQDQATGVAPDASGGAYVCGMTYGSFGAPSAGALDVWITRHDAAGNPLWVRQLGTSGNEQPWSAAPDASGGVFVSGYTEGSLGGPNAGGRDAWLARYDGTGNPLWIRQVGTNADESVEASAPDGAGGVFLLGRTRGDLGAPNAGGEDIWLAHYDAAGNQGWLRQLGTSADDFGSAATADGFGGAYVSGWTWSDLAGPSAGYIDAWTARYDAAGNQLWIRQFGTSAGEYLHASAPDGSGGVVLVGRTDGSFGGPLTGWWDIWVARYDGSGNRLWLGQFGSSAVDWPQAAAADGAGGVFLGGWTEGNLGATNAGGMDVWLAHWAEHVELVCEPGVAGVSACPCANPAAASYWGCDNSSASGGASLHAAGNPYLAADTLAFTASGERPSALSVLLQGTTRLANGVVYGQGVSCAGGQLRRLFARTASGGVVVLPDFGAGDPSLSARSSALGDTLSAGQSRWYVVVYRDPFVLGGCSALSTFNVGPTMRVDWQP